MENRQFSFLICVKTLGGRGRCHCNVHIFCCTSSPTEKLDAEFSYYYLPNFLIFDQLNRTFYIEIRLVDNFKLLTIDLSIKKSFKCTHARISVFSLTQGKWMRNFRGNCLSQLVILLLVWLMLRLSELFFTPYSLEILVNFESFPKCHSVICKTGPSQSWEDARTYYKGTKKKREALPWA